MTKDESAVDAEFARSEDAHTTDSPASPLAASVTQPKHRTTKKALALERKTEATRSDKVDDNGAEAESDSEVLKHNALDRSLPGAGSLRALDSVAPFLSLAQWYADSLYPKHGSKRSRMSKFTSDHKWIVRCSYTLDPVSYTHLTLPTNREV